jgi:predicted NBD/HSP70 family sugar kinase
LRISYTRKEFVAAAIAGNKEAGEVLADAGTRTARHLADRISLFDPEVIVVGGEAVQFGDLLLDPIKTAMKEFLFFANPGQQTDWVPSSWARGAVALAAQSIFDFEHSPSG